MQNMLITYRLVTVQCMISKGVVNDTLLIIHVSVYHITQTHRGKETQPW